MPNARTTLWRFATGALLAASGGMTCARLLALGLLLGLGVGACGSARNYRVPPPSPADSSVGVGDVFEVKVVGEEQLDGQHRVAQDGTIRFPYVGRVHVANLEAQEIEEVLTAALIRQGYLANPQVRVFVQESNSRRINVMGEVREPGTFPMSNGMTIVDAVSLAGGFTAIARQGNVRVTRIEGDQTRSYRVPVDDITNGEEQDFPLQAGDIIYVEQRPF